MLSSVQNSNFAPGRETGLMETTDPPVNSLGLDLEDPTVSSSSDIPHSIPDPNADDTSLTEIAADDAEKSVSADDAKPRDKKKPYVNLERVKTGGIPRVCLCFSILFNIPFTSSLG